MVYEKFIQSQERANCCPVCARDFEDDSEIETFKEQVEKMRSFIPGRQEQLRAQLTKMEERKTKLASVADTWVKWETLSKDLASIEETVNAFTAQREEAVNKADVASTNMIEVDNCKIKADKLLLIARNVSRINGEVQELTGEITDIEDELSFTGSTRTMSDVQQELEDLNDRRYIHFWGL